jgi:hypothetical protein
MSTTPGNFLKVKKMLLWTLTLTGIYVFFS